MDKRPLGRTGLAVPNICLGTMTFGQQNTEREAHQMLDYAYERGVHFLDAAELYPIPPKPQTRGLTEQYIGSWMKARGNRDKIILATKVVGRTAMPWFRENGDTPCLDAANIDFALTRSLKTLGTDYIDLYQLHWPDRPREIFGFHTYKDFDISASTPFEDTLEALVKHVEAGRLRHIGISNETAWGTMKYLHLAEKNGWPRIASIQNVYSLVSRRFDYDLAEISLRENVGLLAYSPLAQGFLTGKYRNGARPEGARNTLFGRMERYESVDAERAFEACEDTARELGLTPEQFALKFVDSRPFTTSTIIGATTMKQLEKNIDAFEIDWSEDMDKAAHELHCKFRSPCP
ncbi:MAG TPA: aldo/keto reductase [Hellea balneolensis]|uniref:Aldo/keto reductase n=1 Tax=Hellea balneolensis TaxID=287478 RepID=A0A7C5QV94_9PROT|nr:aldo/keto reductase [Hellea balneolensis]